MKQEDLQRLIGVRDYVISCHNSLDPNSGEHSVVKQSDVAYDFSKIIAKIDEILGAYVSFE